MSKRLLFAALSTLALLSLAAACAGAVTSPAAAPEGQESEASIPERSALRIGTERVAHDLAGIAGWLNSEPFTLESQRGNVVLIDFWTYTCVNCIRTLPYLKSWHEKYASRGLVIVGVHTPEFEFEKLRDNVEKAVADFGITYPVAQDNDFATWRAYNNRYWPAKYLIDQDGLIRYTHFGEGAYDETERRIRDLLTEAGRDVSDIAPGGSPGPAIDPAAVSAGPGFGTTRELYAGYQRNYNALVSRIQPPYIIQRDFYQARGSDILYQDPGGHENHFLYLHGLWRNEDESIVHARETQAFEDYIAIRFFATSVNAVIAPASGGAFTVRVTLDGQPLRPEQAGADITFDAEGKSLVEVNEPRMYHLVNLDSFEGHDLKLSSNSPEFALFTFTFGSYKYGEPRPQE